MFDDNDTEISQSKKIEPDPWQNLVETITTQINDNYKKHREEKIKQIKETLEILSESNDELINLFGKIKL